MSYKKQTNKQTPVLIVQFVVLLLYQFSFLSSVPFALQRSSSPLCSGSFKPLDKFLREAQVEQLHGGQVGQVGEGLEQPLPAQLQQAGHHQPDLEERAGSPVLVDVHHAAMNVHTTRLRNGEMRSETTGEQRSLQPINQPTNQPINQPTNQPN